MIFLFADDLDLRLQLNAGDAVYLVLNVFNEPEHIVKACSAAVDDEARVLFAHLRAADGAALETGLVNERGGVVRLRDA